jgi:NTP pyrophosphatase (non-canonical NTP hydrolase)
MEVNKFERRIKEWAEARNLVLGSKPIDQLTKLDEEVDEFKQAVQDFETFKHTQSVPRLNQILDDIRDGVGDTCVVLAVICTQLGISFEGCLEYAWNEIKDRKGKMVNGVFVKEQ